MQAPKAPPYLQQSITSHDIAQPCVWVDFPIEKIHSSSFPQPIISHRILDNVVIFVRAIGHPAEHQLWCKKKKKKQRYLCQKRKRQTCVSHAMQPHSIDLFMFGCNYALNDMRRMHMPPAVRGSQLVHARQLVTHSVPLFESAELPQFSASASSLELTGVQMGYFADACFD